MKKAIQKAKANPKTTAAGIVGLLITGAQAYMAVASGAPVNWAGIATQASGSLGLILAGDAGK